MAVNMSTIGGIWMGCGPQDVATVTDVHYYQAAMNESYTQAGKRVPFVLEIAPIATNVSASDSPYPPFNNLGGANTWGIPDNTLKGSTYTVPFFEAGLGLLTSGANANDVASLEYYMMYDKASEGTGYSFGLFEAVTDNFYDGCMSSANATWATSCATNHTYTGGTACGCKDTNNNYEGAQLAYGSTCTSGGSAPSWPASGIASYGKTTTDGTCSWRNEGNNAPVPESATQVGSSGHAAQYGNNTAGGFITPVQNFATGITSWTDSHGNVRTGICDPATSPSAASGGGQRGGGSMW
jgi:hypothetical protein